MRYVKFQLLGQNIKYRNVCFVNFCGNGFFIYVFLRDTTIAFACESNDNTFLDSVLEMTLLDFSIHDGLFYGNIYNSWIGLFLFYSYGE